MISAKNMLENNYTNANYGEGDYSSANDASTAEYQFDDMIDKNTDECMEDSLESSLKSPKSDQNQDDCEIDKIDLGTNQSTAINDGAAISAGKKKRQRRNPVWPHFTVVAGVASCKQCNYSTKSVFSTNLKVHLRTHHHTTYKMVMKAEEEQQVAMQKSFTSCATATVTSTTPFVHKLTSTALPPPPPQPPAAIDNCPPTSSELCKKLSSKSMSLSDILTRIRQDIDKNGTKNNVSSPTVNANPTTPNVNCDSENIFGMASTSAYDLTYSSLLNGGRIDEGSLPAINQSTSMLKRRRLRRHPVWRFFKDVDGSKSVGCIKCTFSTASPFSTNLKMHLKAHHKNDYLVVLRLEAQQREEEGIRGDNCVVSPKRKCSEQPVVGLDAAQFPVSQTDLHKGLKKALCDLAKRTSNMSENVEDEKFASMSTSERLKAMVDIAANQAHKTNNEKSNFSGKTGAFHHGKNASMSGITAVANTLLARFGFSDQNLLQSSPILHKNSFSKPQTSTTRQTGSLPSSGDGSKSVRTVSKKLPTGEVVKVRMMRKDHDSDTVQTETSSAKLLPEAISMLTPNIDVASSIISIADVRSDIQQIKDTKTVRDESLARLMDKSKAFFLLGYPEFKQFVETLAPDYQLPSSGYLKRLAETFPSNPTSEPQVSQKN